MIGYFFLQALENALPGRHVVSLIGQTEVDADDPAFADPTKFVGPVYTRAVAEGLAAERGWQIREDGTAWRRVVPSPEPRAIVELAMIRVLVGDCAVVICSGGGGIPVVRGDDGTLHGAEAVVDKDLAAALLARELEADALLLLTDVDGVEVGFGTPRGHTDPAHDRRPNCAPGRSPPAPWARRWTPPAVSSRPRDDRAMIGRLQDAVELLEGTRGTIIGP